MEGGDDSATGPPAGPAGPDRWRAALAPALLLALAAAQLLLVATLHLSPWKGGGFGMFSTNDHGAFRQVRVTTADGRAVPLPDDLDRMRRKARELPSPAYLRELVRELRARVPVEGPLRVEVWRTVFAPGNLAPSRRRVAELEVD